MSARRILVEKTVLFLGKWDVNRVNEDVVRLIDIDSREKRGKKIRLQLTTEGLQVARGMFQDPQPNDFIPISIILNIATGKYGPLNVMCFTRGKTTNYSVVVYTCTSDYDCAEFVDNYRRLRRGVTVDGNNFDLRPIEDNNWSLGTTVVPEPQGLVYIQKNQRMPIVKGKIITVPPAHNHDKSMVLKRSEQKVVAQNGNGYSQTHSDSGIVTNGTTSTEQPRNKPKRSKSFKLFDSLKNKSKRDPSPSPRREKKDKSEKKSQTNGHHVEEVRSVNGVQPAAADQYVINAELSENVQQLSKELKDIKLLLENNNVAASENENKAPPSGVVYKQDSGTETQIHKSYAASDSETTRSRMPSDKTRFKSNSMSRNHVSRNGEIKPGEYRVPVGYVTKRPVRVSHDVPIHVHTQRTRAYSNGTDPRQYGGDVQMSPSGYSVSSSVTLPRSYRTDPAISPGSKNAPRVTFDETATESTSRRSSTRSNQRHVNHGPRAADTVVKPIERVYAHQNAVYGHPRGSVVVGPGVRQIPISTNVYRHSAHDREYIANSRRNGANEIGL